MIKDYFRIKLRRIPHNCPEKNGIVERFHLSLKTEAFKNVVPMGLHQSQRICREYQDYYNKYRPHQGICGKIPKRTDYNSRNKTKFFRKEHLGGKIFSFEPDILDAA